MKALYSKFTGKLLFCIYNVSNEELKTLEPLIGFPDFEFTKEQSRMYGALQRKYGLHYWKPYERPLRPANLYPIELDDDDLEDYYPTDKEIEEYNYLSMLEDGVDPNKDSSLRASALNGVPYFTDKEIKTIRGIENEK